MKIAFNPYQLKLGKKCNPNQEDLDDFIDDFSGEENDDQDGIMIQLLYESGYIR